MKRLLITGSSGLVGSAMKTIERKDFHYIYFDSKSCDLTDYSATLAAFQKAKPDIIVHLAANVGGLFKNMSEPVRMFEDNILINTNVIKAAHNCGVQELIACLSTCVFPDNIGVLDESCLHNGPPHHSNEGYAHAKRMLEVQCRLYCSQYKRRYFCIVPTNIYGPQDNFNIEDGHVIPSLIHKCYLAKKNNTPLVIWGSGKPLREFIYSKDIAELTMWVLENYNESEPIILSTSEEVTIKHAVETIVKYMEFNGEIVFDSTKPDGQYRKPSDNSKLKKYLPDYKFTSFDDGIKETIKWFIANYETCRK
jgi:GDP-L-fucose synthase